MTGTGGEVTRVIANLTAGPDGCGGWAYMLEGELAHKKLQPAMGGKAPQKEFLWTAPMKKPQKY